MKRLHKLLTFTAALLMIASVSSAQLSSYSEDFELLYQADPDALGYAGWIVHGNVYNSGSCLYAYGPFPAPNAFTAFSSIASGQGGSPQGTQQLVVFSDYNNVDHGNALTIESNVYQEQVIGADDVGKAYRFQFDAKLGDIQMPSTALAFIKTVDWSTSGDCPGIPGLSNSITLDMTSIPTTWWTYSIIISITADMVGHLLQFGFLNSATNYTASGIFYDNVNFEALASLPAETTTWGQVKSLYE